MNRYTTSFDDKRSCGLLMCVGRCFRASDLPTFQAIRDHASVFMTVLQNGKMSQVDRKLLERLRNSSFSKQIRQSLSTVNAAAVIPSFAYVSMSVCLSVCVCL